MSRSTYIFEKQKEKMTDDPLKFMLTFMRLLKNGIFKKVSLSAVLAFQVFNISSVYLMTLDRSTFRQYIAGFLLTQPGFFSILVALIITSKIDYLAKVTSEFSWSVNSAGLQIENKIFGRCKMLKISTILLTITFSVTHLALVIPLIGDEENYIHIIKICRLYTGPFFHTLMMLLYVGALIFGYGLSFCMVFSAYLTSEVAFQFYLLKEHLFRISEGYENANEDELMYDEGYQNTIYKRLTLCCTQHVNILKLTGAYMVISKRVMLLIPVASLVPVSAGYFIIQDISPPSNVRMILVLINCAIAVMNLCITGQHVEDLSGEIFDVATQCPWVYWNKKNRQALWLFLANSTEPFRASSYASVTLNYRLLLLLYKWGYSIATLLY